VSDVVHPGMRSTGSAGLALFSNLLGLAIGPLLVGVLSDIGNLQQAIQVVPVFSVVAAMFFIAARISDLRSLGHYLLIAAIDYIDVCKALLFELCI